MPIHHDFDFHAVRRIVIAPEAHFQGLYTRRIYLIDRHGEEIPITCYSEPGCAGIPVAVRAAEEEDAA